MRKNIHREGGKKKVTMYFYQKKSQSNMFRERSILTGPKSTIHYEYYIMSPI